MLHQPLPAHQRPMGWVTAVLTHSCDEGGPPEKVWRHWCPPFSSSRKKEVSIDNLLVLFRFIIEMALVNRPYALGI